MKKYEGDMMEYVENLKKYEEIYGKYEGNMMKYRQQDLEKFRAFQQEGESYEDTIPEMAPSTERGKAGLPPKR